MRLLVIQNGRLRDPALRQVRDSYLDRFRRFGSLGVEEREVRGRRSLWPTTSCWRVLLDERGRSWTSPQLAERLADWTMRHGTVAFAIGAAEGHDPETDERADERWSLSPLTLPHQLAHVLVVEQLYRAADILAGGPYHKV